MCIGASTDPFYCKFDAWTEDSDDPQYKELEDVIEMRR